MRPHMASTCLHSHVPILCNARANGLQACGHQRRPVVKRSAEIEEIHSPRCRADAAPASRPGGGGRARLALVWRDVGQRLDAGDASLELSDELVHDELAAVGEQ